jgi:EpsI family protein
MPALDRRHFLVGAALGLASGVAIARQPRVDNPRIPKGTFAQWVPTHVGDWTKVGSSGVVLPPPDSLSDRLYDNLVTGTYDSSSEPLVMMLIAYNNRQDGVVQVHRPEVCYPVGGYQLSATRELALTVLGRPLPARIFTAVGPDRTEQVVYLTRLGAAFPRTWAEQRLAVARENLAGEVPDGLLIRFSSLGGDQAAASRVLGAFADAFMRAAAPPLQHLLFGPGRRV